MLGMSSVIKFPPVDASGHPRDYSKNLNELSKDQDGRAFCPKFSRVMGIGLDEVSTDFTSWTGRAFSTVDAVVDVRKDPDVSRENQRAYFIEFKNRTLQDLDTQGTSRAKTKQKREDEPIHVELSKKGLESLLLSAATVFRSENVDDVAFTSEYIVVYNDRRPQDTESPAVKAVDEDFAGLAGEVKDSFGIPVRWELSRFKRKKLFRSVHTWSIDDFNSIAPAFLKSHP